MLPEHHRLRHHSDFTAVMRAGRRCGRRDVVVHFLGRDAQGAAADGSADEIAVPRPRVGLIVSTAVGNSVVRHRVSRRLRHVSARYLRRLPDGASVVLRALPGAATATSAQLDEQIGSALRKLGALRADPPPVAASPAGAARR